MPKIIHDAKNDVRALAGERVQPEDERFMESVKKSGVGRGMAFEINVDCRLPNSHLRRKPNVSIGQKPG